MSTVLQDLLDACESFRNQLVSFWFSEEEIPKNLWHLHLASCVDHIIQNGYDNFNELLSKTWAHFQLSSSISNELVLLLQQILFEIAGDKEPDVLGVNPVVMRDCWQPDAEGLQSWFRLFQLLDDQGAIGSGDADVDINRIDIAVDTLITAIDVCANYSWRPFMIEKLEHLSSVVPERRDEILNILEHEGKSIIWDHHMGLEDLAVGNKVQFSSLGWEHKGMNWTFRDVGEKEFVLELGDEELPGNFIGQVKEIQIFSCKLKYLGEAASERTPDDDMEARDELLKATLSELIPEFPDGILLTELGGSLQRKLSIDIRPTIWIKKIGHYDGMKDACEKIFENRISIVGEDAYIMASLIPKSQAVSAEPPKIGPEKLYSRKDGLGFPADPEVFSEVLLYLCQTVLPGIWPVIEQSGELEMPTIRKDAKIQFSYLEGPQQDRAGKLARRLCLTAWNNWSGRTDQVPKPIEMFETYVSYLESEAFSLHSHWGNEEFSSAFDTYVENVRILLPRDDEFDEAADDVSDPDSSMDILVPDWWFTAIDYVSDEGSCQETAPVTFRQVKTPLADRLKEAHPRQTNAKRRNEIWKAFNYSIGYDTNDRIPDLSPFEWCDQISDYLGRIRVDSTVMPWNDQLKECFGAVRKLFS